MKAKNLIILVLLIILALTVPALASRVNMTFEEFEPVEISWSTRNDKLMEVLPKTSRATTDDGTVHELKIDWDLSNFYPWQPMEYVIRGYYNNEDKLLSFPRAFELKVTVLPTENPELFVVPNSERFVYGTSIDEISKKIPKEVTLVEDSHKLVYNYTQSVNWDLTGQKFDKPGTYTVKAVYSLRENLVSKGFDKPVIEFDIIIEKAVVTKVLLPNIDALDVERGLNADQLNEGIKAYIDTVDVKLATDRGAEFKMEEYEINSDEYFTSKAATSTVFIKPIDTDKYNVKDGLSFKIVLNRGIDERVTRIYGDDRYQTAVKIAEEFYEEPKSVVIASGTNYPDALASAPLADTQKGPIILVPNESLNMTIKDYLEKISFESIKIVGGINSISDKISDEIKDLLDKNPDRIWGDNRVATSIEISKKMFELNKSLNTVIIVDGYNFADALSAGFISTTKDAPIILFQTGYDYSELQEMLDNVSNVYIVGGENSVPEQALKKSCLIPVDALVKRFSGKDRYLTALEVSRYFQDDIQGIILASGEVYPDALVASAISGEYKYSILLTTKGSLNDEVQKFIKEKSDIPVYIIGGPNTISEGIEKTIAE